MPRPSRARRILKWTSLLVLATWVASLWLNAILILPGDQCALGVAYGAITIEISSFNVRMLYMSSGVWTHEWRVWGFAPPDYQKLFGDLGTFTAILIPLWIPLLLTAIPTAWLWHRDRRLFSSPPDHLSCRGCGYDLTGNLSGVCPECGDKVHPPAVLADPECGEKLTTVAQFPSRQGRA